MGISSKIGVFAATCLLGCSILCSCGTGTELSGNDSDAADTPNSNGNVQDSTEGATKMNKTFNGAYITDLKYAQHGMAVSPYYTIEALDDGTYAVGISASEPVWDAVEDVEDCPFGGGWHGDEEDPFEDISSSRVIVGEEEMKVFSERLEAAGLANMDGYHVSRDLGPGVLDGGDGFRLVVRLSDGSTLTASSTNAYPDNYQDFYQELSKFFDEHQDYSRLYPSQFPDSPLHRVWIECSSVRGGSSASPYLKLELNRGWKRWSIVVTDKQGEILGHPIEISDYADVENEDDLPFDEVLSLVKELGIEDKNHREVASNGGEQSLRIDLSFENGQQFEYRTTVLPDGYDKFREELVWFLEDYYQRHRDAR